MITSTLERSARVSKAVSARASPHIEKLEVRSSGETGDQRFDLLLRLFGTGGVTSKTSSRESSSCAPKNARPQGISSSVAAR